MRLEPVRSSVPDKVEVVARATFRFRLDCFSIVLTDRCGNVLYSQAITVGGVDDPAFVWNNIPALTPPPAASPPLPPDVPSERERASSRS